MSKPGAGRAAAVWAAAACGGIKVLLLLPLQAGLLLFGLGLPVVAGLLLWHNRARLDEWDFAWKVR